MKHKWFEKKILRHCWFLPEFHSIFGSTTKAEGASVYRSPNNNYAHHLSPQHLFLEKVWKARDVDLPSSECSFCPQLLSPGWRGLQHRLFLFRGPTAWLPLQATCSTTLYPSMPACFLNWEVETRNTREAQTANVLAAGEIIQPQEAFKKQTKACPGVCSLFLSNIVMRFNVGRRGVAKNVISGISRAWVPLFVIRNGCWVCLECR